MMMKVQFVPAWQSGRAQFKADYPVRDWFKLSVNIGWKEHKGFPKVMYADRPIGTDSLN